MKTAVDGDDEATSELVNAATAAMLREFLITSTRRATEEGRERTEEEKRRRRRDGQKSVIIAASVAFVRKSQKENAEWKEKRDMRENRGRSL